MKLLGEWNWYLPRWLAGSLEIRLEGASRRARAGGSVEAMATAAGTVRRAAETYRALLYYVAAVVLGSRSRLAAAHRGLDGHARPRDHAARGPAPDRAAAAASAQLAGAEAALADGQLLGANVKPPARTMRRCERLLERARLATSSGTARSGSSRRTCWLGWLIALDPAGAAQARRSSCSRCPLWYRWVGQRGRLRVQTSTPSRRRCLSSAIGLVLLLVDRRTSLGPLARLSRRSRPACSAARPRTSAVAGRAECRFASVR